MMDENIACLRTHRNNIARYRACSKPSLRILSANLLKGVCPKSNRNTSVLAAGTFPMTFRIPKAPEKQPTAYEAVKGSLGTVL